MERVKCTQCNGYYKIREGKYGFFGGCSNFPRCKSTLKMPDMLAQFFKVNGVNIYGWDRVCRNCKKTSKVYTYYLDLGTILYLDNILEKKYSTISMLPGPDNICKHCGEEQDITFEFGEPREIIADLCFGHMEKYLVETLEIEPTDEFIKQIKLYF